MNWKQAENYSWLVARLDVWQFNQKEVDELLRIERILRRWGQQHQQKTAVRDTRKGALRKLEAIMARHPQHVAYYQPDPDRCALWIVPRAAIPPGMTLERSYTNGVPVWIE